MTTDQLVRRVEKRRVKIEQTRQLLADLFDDQHLDFVALYLQGVPKLQIAKMGSTDKQQVHKAIQAQFAKHPELADGVT